MAASWLTVSVVALGGLTGCKKPPQDAIDGAERALLDAEARKDCSQDKYAAAQKLLDEAKKTRRREEVQGGRTQGSGRAKDGRGRQEDG